MSLSFQIQFDTLKLNFELSFESEFALAQCILPSLPVHKTHFKINAKICNSAVLKLSMDCNVRSASVGIISPVGSTIPYVSRISASQMKYLIQRIAFQR